MLSSPSKWMDSLEDFSNLKLTFPQQDDGFHCGVTAIIPTDRSIPIHKRTFPNNGLLRYYLQRCFVVFFFFFATVNIIRSNTHTYTHTNACTNDRFFLSCLLDISAYLVEIISHVDNVIRNQTRRDFQQIPHKLSMKVDDC